MPDSINEQIADEIRAHAIDFERFSADVVQRVIALLLLLELDIIRQIRDIDPTEPLRKTYRDQRLAKLLEQTRASIREGYKGIVSETTADLLEVAELTTTATVAAVNTVVGVELMTVAVAPEKFRALVDNTMIEGAPSKDWWAKQAGDTVFRFQRAVQMGYAQGETVDQIVRRVKGTSARNYKDGLMDVTRRNATSLVHTSVQAVSNSARRETFKASDDLIFGLVQVSTLDNRTGVICRSYSGKSFTLDGKPIGHSLPYNGGVPRHFRCRSVEVPLLRDIDDITTGKANNLPESTQASMDGQVPADLDFENWLKTKPKSFQEEVLGPSKWDLWSKGKVSMADMLDFTGRPLTVAELRAKYG